MLDQARITVSAGAGGGGTIAFRREKFVPRGGPAGGDGGRGGDMYLVADRGVNTLNAFRYKREFKAKAGVFGGGSNKSGKDGEVFEIIVPVGTQVYELTGDDESRELIGDLTLHAQRMLVAQGGRGGRGNARFVTSTLREPLLAEAGEEGQERVLKLELKLIADVGFVGLPNAGKSSLLAALSNATPKVADYPFTTLEPYLGVVEHHMQTLVAIDIPGLIEGAHEGIGLGHEFLRHVERTRVIVHLIDGGEGDAVGRLRTINRELGQFDSRLLEKPQMVVVNKVDIPEVELLQSEIKRELMAEAGVEREVLFISAVGRTGLDGLKDAMFRLHNEQETGGDALDAYDAVTLRDDGTAGPGEDVPVLRPVVDAEPAAAAIRTKDGFLVLHPRAVRLATGSDLSKWKAQVQMRDQLKRLGVTESLVELGIKSGDEVAIGEWNFVWE